MQIDMRPIGSVRPALGAVYELEGGLADADPKDGPAVSRLATWLGKEANVNS
jgi:hypothetical protein